MTGIGALIPILIGLLVVAFLIDHRFVKPVKFGNVTGMSFIYLFAVYACMAVAVTVAALIALKWCFGWSLPH